MKTSKYQDYIFFEEFSNTRKTKSEGNVMVVYGNWSYSQDKKLKECIGAVYFHPNSAVCGSSTDDDYIKLYCKKITVQKAKKIHPKLFDYLDKST